MFIYYFFGDTLLFNVLLTIAALFVIFLLARRLFGIKFCVLCASIIITWVGLFLLFKQGQLKELPLLMLLIGESVTGIYYFVLRKVANQLKIFSLPFFLTLTALAYYLVNPFKETLLVFGLLLGLWLIAWILFIYRHDPGKKPLDAEVADCCDED